MLTIINKIKSLQKQLTSFLMLKIDITTKKFIQEWYCMFVLLNFHDLTKACRRGHFVKKQNFALETERKYHMNSFLTMVKDQAVNNKTNNR